MVVEYLTHLVEQGKTYGEAREHVKLRFGLTDERLDSRIEEARNEAERILSATGGMDHIIEDGS